MTTVLMICYYFPPARNGGVERSIRFAYYLPEMGITPSVITTDLYGITPNAHHATEPLSLYKRLKGSYPAPTHTPNAPTTQEPSRWVRLLSTFFYVPDRAITWLPFALLKALWQPADIIYTSSPPYSAHLLGMILKALRRKKWVADFRDPWTIDPIGGVLRTVQWRMSLEKRLEKWCFRYADAVILNTHSAYSAYIAQYPEYAHKCHVVTNGYAPEAFEAPLKGIRQQLGIEPDVMLISHLGSLSRDVTVYGEQPFLPLLRAIRTLINVNLAQRLCFLFVGKVPNGFAKSVETMGLTDTVRLLGTLPHEDAISLMQESDALLLFDPTQDGTTYIRGKVYEYVASQKPIIGIVGDGATRTFLEEVGNMRLASPDSETAILTAFQHALAQDFLPLDPHFKHENISYRTLTHRLAELIIGLRDHDK